MYLLLFYVMTATSFHVKHVHVHRPLFLKNDKLLDVDNELNKEKQKIKKLLIKKNEILKTHKIP